MSDKKKDQPISDQEPIDMREEDRKRCQIVGLMVDNCGSKLELSLREAKSQNTPLHLCAMNGYALTAEALIKAANGAGGLFDVDPVNKISKTPLIYACMEDHLEAVKVLLKFGADPIDKKDMLHNEWSALHFAIMQDNDAVVRALFEDAKVKVLLKFGADP